MGWLWLLLALLLAWIAWKWVRSRSQARRSTLHDVQRRIWWLQRRAQQRHEQERLALEQTAAHNRAEEAERMYRLGCLHRDGTPDTYDARGIKIPGIRPNPSQCLHFFRQAIQLGHQQAEIDLADVIGFGMFGLRERPRQALELFENVRRRNAGAMPVVLDISDRIDRLTSEVNNQVFVAQRQDHHVDTDVDLPDLINDRELMDIQHVLLTQHRAPPIVPNEPERLQQGDDAPVREARPRRRRRRRRRDREAFAPRHANSQNVHDSAVLGTLNDSIQKLRKATNMSLTREQALAQIRAHIQEQLPENDRQKDAIRALDAMERHNQAMSRFENMPETEALQIVWNRIHDDKQFDDETRQQLKQNLCDELSDCIEHGHPVCSTGRFTRVLDTLNVVDPLVQIKPTTAINQEMLTKAAKVREELREQLTEEERAQVDDIDNPESDAFDQKVQQQIKKTLADEYVKPGILTPRNFDRMLGEWIDHV